LDNNSSFEYLKPHCEHLCSPSSQGEAIIQCSLGSLIHSVAVAALSSSCVHSQVLHSEPWYSELRNS
jgi:hypothetical protein